MTQPNATFWGVGLGDPHVGPMTPKFERGRVLCTVHLANKFHHPSLRLIVRKLSCSQTHTQTNKQTNRRRWKHPLPFAVLRRWVKLTGVVWMNVRITDKPKQPCRNADPRLQPP